MYVWCTCTHMCMLFEARGWHQMTSLITLYLIFKTRSLTKPGACQFSLASLANQVVPRILCLCLSSATITGVHSSTWLFFYIVLGIQIQVFMITWQALCWLPPSIPSPGFPFSWHYCIPVSPEKNFSNHVLKMVLLGADCIFTIHWCLLESADIIECILLGICTALCFVLLLRSFKIEVEYL